MKIRYSPCALMVIVFVLGGTSVEAGRTPRDSSGDPMQRFNSQMMSSPMMRFPAVLGLSPWPYINYPPAPSTTIVNVQVEVPDVKGPVVTSPPPGHPQFWIARCGGFVELEADSTMSVLEEEGKPCAQ